MLAAKERTQQSGGAAGLSTAMAVMAIGFAVILLQTAPQMGYRSATQHIRLGVAVAICGGLIAIGVINGIRQTRRRKLLSLWWIGLLVGALLFQIPF